MDLGLMRPQPEEARQHELLAERLPGGGEEVRRGEPAAQPLDLGRGARVILLDGGTQHAAGTVEAEQSGDHATHADHRDRVERPLLGEAPQRAHRALPPSVGIALGPAGARREPVVWNARGGGNAPMLVERDRLHRGGADVDAEDAGGHGAEVSAARRPGVKRARRAGRGSVAHLGSRTGLGDRHGLAIVPLPPAAGPAARSDGRRHRLESA